MKRIKSYAWLLAAICGTQVMTMPHSYARDSRRLKPLDVLIKQNDAGFHDCKVQTIKDWKAAGGNKANKESLRPGLNTCRELYPTSVDYLKCKRAAVAAHRSDRNSLRQALANCKTELKAQTFAGNATLPFWLDDSKKVYFGGIGLNTEINWDVPGLPRYTCDPLKAAIDNPDAREYFLFGNSPQAFAALEKAPLKKILGLLGEKSDKKKAEFTTLRGLGRAYRDGNSYNLFFPSGHCAHAASLLPNYLNIKIYYLLDDALNKLHPYFGVAFFNPKHDAENINTYADLVAKTLGDNYHSSVSPSGQYLIVSQEPIKEWDAEGDPKNLCLQPRPHQWVAVLKTQGELKDRAEYLLLASIKNLCDYGDQLAGRLKQEF